MKRFFALFFLFVIIFFPGFCQENKTSPVRILFHGLVMDASSLEPIANSQILINRKFSSVRDKRLMLLIGEEYPPIKY